MVIIQNLFYFLILPEKIFELSKQNIFRAISRKKISYISGKIVEQKDPVS